MNQMTRREAIVLGTSLLPMKCGLCFGKEETPRSGPAISPRLADITRKGRTFLADLLDPELGLLPEYRDANVYWLYHDNYLAAKILNDTHPEIARTIRSAIQREGVEQSGKIELLFGELQNPLPFRQFQLKDVRKLGNKLIRTEVVKPEPVIGWENYADFLLMACIAEKDRTKARGHWDAASKIWDGKGFDDEATRQLKRYSTYKLGLALIAAKKLDVKPPSGSREKLLSLQADSGGWITDYDAEGQRIGLANVETTCLSIMGIESIGE